MPDATRSPRRLAWIHSLKFQIVAITVATAVVAAVVVAHVVLLATEGHMQRLLVQEQSDDAERTATLLGTKVDMLRDALKATARQAPASVWADPAAMRQHLTGNPALGSLFENVLAARPSGELLGRLSMGKLSTELPSIADRQYFQEALRTDQPVIEVVPVV